MIIVLGLYTFLENLNNSGDVSRVWENIKEINKTLAEDSLVLYELKRHKPCFDEKCSRFLDERKQAKMQWFEVPNRNNIRGLEL